MKKILLLSDGLNTKTGYKLIEKQLKSHQLTNKKIFLCYEPHFSIEEDLIRACLKLGFCRENIYSSTNEDAKKTVLNCNYIYITEGNTFKILKALQEKDLLQPIRKAVNKGVFYIGASAGAMIAGKDIALSSDSNDVGLTDLQGLGLIDGVILPHYKPSELTRFKNNSDIEVRKRYAHWHSVDDGRVLNL